MLLAELPLVGPLSMLLVDLPGLARLITGLLFDGYIGKGMALKAFPHSD
jgi:hypothetical protein